MKTLLIILISFIAVTSILSGLLMLLSPDGRMLDLSLKLLAGTPFKDFKIPGILLTVLVGMTNLIAALSVLIKSPKRYNWALTGGSLTFGWIIAQIAMIDTLHRFHFLYLMISLIVILCSLKLKGKELL